MSESIGYYVGNRLHVDMEGMPIVADNGTEFYINPDTEWESLGRPGADEARWKPEEGEDDE